VVQSVHIFQTRLLTPDNREIILPNSQITSAPIINYTGRGVRRIDVPVPVGYDEDLPALRAALKALLEGNPRLQQSPAPEVQVGAFGEKTVTVQVQAWVVARDYAAVRAELLESVLDIFQRRGLRSPVPAREVHLHHMGTPQALLPDEALKPATGRDA
jgi:small-conductance mechanosensitive channel